MNDRPETGFDRYLKHRCEDPEFAQRYAQEREKMKSIIQATKLYFDDGSSVEASVSLDVVTLTVDGMAEVHPVLEVSLEEAEAIGNMLIESVKKARKGALQPIE